MNQELLPVVTISQPAFINHADLPSIANASLPSLYSKAQTAIAECARIDECKDWADKAQALASYAKQANNREMYNTALRIIARAYRRCGQLLKEIEPGTGGQPFHESTNRGFVRNASKSTNSVKSTVGSGYPTI